MYKTEATVELAEMMKEKVQQNRALLDQLAGLIRAGIARGELRPDLEPEVAAVSLMGLFSGVASLWLLDPNAFSIKDRAKAIVDTFFQGIVAGSDGS